MVNLDNMSSEIARTSKEAYVMVYLFLLLIVIENLLQYNMKHLISLTSEVKSDKIRQVYDSSQLLWIWYYYGYDMNTRRWHNFK